MNKKLMDIYLDYKNNYLLIDTFAMDYGISTEFATKLVNELRIIYKSNYN